MIHGSSSSFLSCSKPTCAAGLAHPTLPMLHARWVADFLVLLGWWKARDSEEFEAMPAASKHGSKQGREGGWSMAAGKGGSNTYY